MKSCGITIQMKPFWQNIWIVLFITYDILNDYFSHHFLGSTTHFSQEPLQIWVCFEWFWESRDKEHKVVTLANQNEADNQMNQPEFETNTCSRWQAWENVFDWLVDKVAQIF